MAPECRGAAREDRGPAVVRAERRPVGCSDAACQLVARAALELNAAQTVRRILDQQMVGETASAGSSRKSSVTTLRAARSLRRARRTAQRRMRTTLRTYAEENSADAARAATSSTESCTTEPT